MPVRENTGQKSLHDKRFRIEDKADAMLIFVQCRLHALGLVELGLIRARQEDGWRDVI